MNFKVREMSFEVADRRYAELTRQRDEGSIGGEEFDAERRRLVVRDDDGGRWAKIGKAGEWHYRDGGAWVRGTPPDNREVAPEPMTEVLTAQIPSSRLPDVVEQQENGVWRPSIWVSVAGLGGISLLAMVLVVWVVVPYFRGEPARDLQSETMSVNQSESMTADGPGIDALFVHRATADNVSANSTYLDDPATNDNPDAVVMVTPNWNPGGKGETYNNHPVGVWYDEDAGRWAIFNQDLGDMPEGAAFNVAVPGAN